MGQGPQDKHLGWNWGRKGRSTDSRRWDNIYTAIVQQGIIYAYAHGHVEAFQTLREIFTLRRQWLNRNKKIA